MNLSIKLYIFLIGFIFYSCVEPFIPEVDTSNEMLVVEGLITNAGSKHLIKLSLSSNFNEDNDFIPLRNADVTVIDGNGVNYGFDEVEPGYYYNNNPFVGEIGQSYNLMVETEDGDIYRSDQQIIMPPITADSLEAKWDVRDLYDIDNDGEQTIQPFEGISLWADIKSNSQVPPMVRFQTDVITQYILIDFSDDPDFFYCHLRKNIDYKLNVVIPDFQTHSNTSAYHDVGFIRKGVKVIIPDSLRLMYIHKRIVVLKQFTLNEQSYNFYKQLSDQLEAEGTLFDPSPFQLKGNIFCVNDPTKKAIGIFEASSHVSRSFALNNEPLRPEKLSIRRVPDLNYLSNFGMSREVVPSFWVF